MQNMRDFNSPFSSSWRLISAWAFLNWDSVFPSFSFKIDTSSSNRAVSSWACNNWNRNDSHESCDSVFMISAVSRETESSASDVMPLLTVNDSSVNDSSSRCFLRWKSCRLRWFLSRWSAPCKFRRNCCDVYTHLLSSKAFFDFAFTKMQRANFCNFRQFEFRSNVSSNLLQPLSSKVGSFGKLKKPTLFPLASTVPLWLQRGTQQLIFELELIPDEISSQETVALKKSLLDDR